jgi:hypothetical protein
MGRLLSAGWRPAGTVGVATVPPLDAPFPLVCPSVARILEQPHNLVLRNKESNWLPAPSDRFILMMRLYWPKETDPSILKGTWKPPTVKPAS